MTLQFRARWNDVPPGFAGAEDAAMIPLLNPDEDTIRIVLNEAHLNGAWADLVVQQMFAAAASNRGEIVSIRAGAHQVEEPVNGGFQLHIGTLFRGQNYHLNLQQTMRGKMYIASVSRGAPGGPNYFFEARPGAPPA
jgi:hypothetical protein